jgi:type II secretory pathway pseudopilin PulG
VKLTTRNSQLTAHSLQLTARRRRAFLATEMLVALSILGIVMTGLALTLHSVGRFHRLLWCRQQCLAACQAQIDSLISTGHGLDPNALSVLWPRVSTDVEIRSGQGQWQGLDRVKVTASIPDGGHTVRMTLSRYGDVSKAVSLGGR